MDNLTHALVGLAMGHAGLKRRTPLALTTLAVAANVPDIDVAVYATRVVPMYFRRGWTHGPIAMIVLPLLVAAVVVWWDRRVRQGRTSPPPPVVPREILLLAVLGTWSHPLMDYMNSYGIRLLMPFSGHWFYGDALYIIDPWLYLLLGFGAWIGWRARESARGTRVARVALVAAMVYVAAMFGSNLWARQVVAQGLARAGRDGARFMVTPVALNPLTREVIVDLGTRYERGVVTFSPLPSFRPLGFGVDTQADAPLARQAAATERGRQFLTWSRFPLFVIDPSPDGAVVTLNDYRYAYPGGREGWAGLSIAVAVAAR